MIKCRGIKRRHYWRTHVELLRCTLCPTATPIPLWSHRWAWPTLTLQRNQLPLPRPPIYKFRPSLSALRCLYCAEFLTTPVQIAPGRTQRARGVSLARDWARSRAHVTYLSVLMVFAFYNAVPEYRRESLTCTLRMVENQSKPFPSASSIVSHG